MIRPLVRLVGRVALLAAAFALLGAVYLLQVGAFLVVGATPKREKRTAAAVELVTAALSLLGTYARPGMAGGDGQEQDG